MATINGEHGYTLICKTGVIFDPTEINIEMGVGDRSTSYNFFYDCPFSNQNLLPDNEVFGNCD